MPLSLFEVFVAYIILMRRLGKPPTLRAVAAFLGSTTPNVIRRAQVAEEIWLVEPTIGRRKGHWLALTEFGLERLEACIEGEFPLWFVMGMTVSRADELKVKTVRYTVMTRPHYCQALAALRGLGHQRYIREDQRSPAQ